MFNYTDHQLIWGKVIELLTNDFYNPAHFSLNCLRTYKQYAVFGLGIEMYDRSSNCSACYYVRATGEDDCHRCPLKMAICRNANSYYHKCKEAIYRAISLYKRNRIKEYKSSMKQAIHYANKLKNVAVREGIEYV